MRCHIICTALVIASCSPQAPRTEETNLAAAGNAVDLPATSSSTANDQVADSAPGSAWVYRSEADPMSDRATKLACVRSNNEVHLGFPYGSLHGRLCLRNSPQYGRDAYVALEGEGQILCYSYRDCTVRIRFDDAEARSFPAVGASDNSSNIIFIRSRDRLERELGSADRTAIQLEFYQAGQQAFIFPTAGFDWDA